MDQDQRGVDSESWRVVVLTMIPGGVIYRLADEVLRSLGHRVVGVLTSPGPPRRRSASYLDVVAAVSPSVDVIVSNHPSRWAAMIAPLRPDLIICGGMPWRIPVDVLALPRLGAINVHPALLPRHRGPTAFEWAFRECDRETGFTVHRIDPDFDTGAILAQVRVPIDDEDDVETLLDRMIPLLPDVLGQGLARVARGDAGDPQDETLATYAGRFEEEWRTIDWENPARTIHNQVRSWTGIRETPKGAFGEIEGTRVQITKTRLLPAEPMGDAGVPGKGLRQDGEEWIVQCGDGPIALVAWSQLPNA